MRTEDDNEHCNFTNFRCVKISVASDRGAFSVRYPWMLSGPLNVFFAFRCCGETIDHRKYRK